MRDAFGGAFMIKVFLVFIFIYIVFTSLSLNYAKAFKVKNIIINYLENNEEVDLSKANYRNEMQDFFEHEVVGNLNYNADITCPTTNKSDKDYYCNSIGIIIDKTGKAQNTEGVYYTVSTYVKWDLGFLKILLNLNENNNNPTSVKGAWKISGQTRLIVNE